MEKVTKITRRLEALSQIENDTLKAVSAVILEKVQFYDKCLKSWDNPNLKEKYSPEEIEVAKKCGNSGLDMADSIVNELRILYLGKNFY